MNVDTLLEIGANVLRRTREQLLAKAGLVCADDDERLCEEEAGFFADIKRQALDQKGEVYLTFANNKLNDSNVKSFARGLELYALDESLPNLKSLFLNYGNLTNTGLEIIAKRLLPFRESLERLSLLGMQEVTSLEPLLEAEEMSNLYELSLQFLGLKDELIPEKLCENLPKLREFYCDGLPNPLVFKAEALCKLPTRCTLTFRNCEISVLGGTAYKIPNIQDEPYRQRVEKIMKQASILCGSCISAKALYICGHCEERYYCSTNCQEIDWEQHERVCRR